MLLESKPRFVWTKTSRSRMDVLLPSVGRRKLLLNPGGECYKKSLPRKSLLLACKSVSCRELRQVPRRVINSYMDDLQDNVIKLLIQIKQRLNLNSSLSTGHLSRGRSTNSLVDKATQFEENVTEGTLRLGARQLNKEIGPAYTFNIDADQIRYTQEEKMQDTLFLKDRSLEYSMSESSTFLEDSFSICELNKSFGIKSEKGDIKLKRKSASTDNISRNKVDIASNDNNICSSSVLEKKIMFENCARSQSDPGVVRGNLVTRKQSYDSKRLNSIFDTMGKAIDFCQKVSNSSSSSRQVTEEVIAECWGNRVNRSTEQNKLDGYSLNQVAVQQTLDTIHKSANCEEKYCEDKYQSDNSESENNDDLFISNTIEVKYNWPSVVNRPVFSDETDSDIPLSLENVIPFADNASSLKCTESNIQAEMKLYCKKQPTAGTDTLVNAKIEFPMMTEQSCDDGNECCNVKEVTTTSFSDKHIESGNSFVVKLCNEHDKPDDTNCNERLKSNVKAIEANISRTCLTNEYHNEKNRVDNEIFLKDKAATNSSINSPTIKTDCRSPDYTELWKKIDGIELFLLGTAEELKQYKERTRTILHGTKEFMSELITKLRV